MNEILYIVVFGESLLNDAVTVVLYHMCEVYSQIGIANINVTHLMSGGANFLVVALGGTIIGELGMREIERDGRIETDLMFMLQLHRSDMGLLDRFGDTLHG